MRKLAVLVSLAFAACATKPGPLAPATDGSAEAAAIPEGRTPEERHEVFRAAVTLYEKGEGAAAEALFRSSAATYATLADYSLRYLAKIAEARDEAQAAMAHWQSLVDRFADSPWRAEALLALARARASEGDLSAAERRLEDARREAVSPPLRSGVLWLSSQVARRKGDLTAARASATELRSRYPSSAEARDAREEAWSERGETALVRAVDARAQTALLISEGEISRALELVRDAEQKFARDPEYPALVLLEASALKKSRDREGAVRRFEDLRKRFPSHPAAAEALYRLASMSWNRDDDRTAARLFDLYVRRYPRGEFAADSLYATGRIHQEAERFAEAGRRFAELVRRYPKSTLAAEAAWRVGWCNYRSGQHRKAIAAFGSIVRRDGNERAAALYWQARSLEKTREPAAAVYGDLLERFPDSYYAMLAERRTGRPEGSVITGRIREQPPTADPVAHAPAANSRLARFEELRQMELKPLARIELSHYAREAAEADPLELARAWIEVERYPEVIQIAVRQHLCGLDSPLLSLCYPLGYWPVIQREAERYAVDPFLILALVRQESLFDTEATSPADARGLMQLLPSTATRLEREGGREDDRSNNLYDVDRNVSLGTVYLRKLLDRYPGNVTRALAAYNAGENAVDKWQARYAGLEDDEFVESISYRETRNYVKRVLQNRRVYQAVYQATSPPTTS